MQRVQETYAHAQPGSGEADPGCAPTADTTSQISNADLLRYVGDMVEELQFMCDRTGCTTLTGLLALARAEALLQQRNQLRRRAS
jgi:hypothetical protein